MWASFDRPSRVLQPRLRTPACTNDAYAALMILAEVYRRARRLWSLRPTTDGQHAVTIRIDQLKSSSTHDTRTQLRPFQRSLQCPSLLTAALLLPYTSALSILSAFAEGFSWVLVRKNDAEAVVEKLSVDSSARAESVTSKRLITAYTQTALQCPPFILSHSDTAQSPPLCTAMPSLHTLSLSHTPLALLHPSLTLSLTLTACLLALALLWQV